MTTYVFRSNVAVTPPDGVVLPTLAELIHGPDVGLYSAAMAAAGHEMTQAEVAAFGTFTKAMRSAGLWSKVIEAYPLYGRSNGHLVKLKKASDAAPARLVAHNGWGAAQLETISGLTVGKKATTDNAQSTPCLRTGVTVGQLAAKWGVVAHVGPISISDYSLNCVVGASQNEPATIVTQLSFINGPVAKGYTLLNGYNNSDRSGHDPSGPSFVCGRTIAGGYSIIPTIGQPSIDKTGFVPDRTVGQDRELFLFGRNGMGANAAVTGSFRPQCRMVVLTSEITAAEGAAIQNAMSNLQTALGRQF